MLTKVSTDQIISDLQTVTRSPQFRSMLLSLDSATRKMASVIVLTLLDIEAKIEEISSTQSTTIEENNGGIL